MSEQKCLVKFKGCFPRQRQLFYRKSLVSMIFMRTVTSISIRIVKVKHVTHQGCPKLKRKFFNAYLDVESSYILQHQAPFHAKWKIFKKVIA